MIVPKTCERKQFLQTCTWFGSGLLQIQCLMISRLKASRLSLLASLKFLIVSSSMSRYPRAMDSMSRLDIARARRTIWFFVNRPSTPVAIIMQCYSRQFLWCSTDPIPVGFRHDFLKKITVICVMQVYWQ